MSQDYWDHRPECTDHECYCADPDDPDPVCDCGRPAWACCCDQIEKEFPVPFYDLGGMG